MEIISSLVRTEISMNAITREEDEFVVEGETLGMPSKVYVRPEEIGDMIGVFLSWSAIAYFLRWPFLYARWYLEREDFPQQVRSFGLILSMSLVGVLLLGGRGYLLANPGQGIGVLLSFAVFSFVASRATDRRSPLYAAIILAEIAYHLFLYRQGMDALSYGVWSLAPLALLALIGWRVQKHAGEAPAPQTAAADFDDTDSAEAEERSGSPVANAVFRNGYILASFYAAAFIWSFGAHWSDGPWRLYVPLFGFAAYFFWRFAAAWRIAQLYFGVIYLAVGFFILVHSLGAVPAAYRSLPLLALAISLMIVANAYHEALEFRRLHPLYLGGMMISLIALGYAGGERIPTMTVLFVLAAHYFWLHREGRKKLTAEATGDQFVLQTSFGLANGAAYLALLLMFIFRFQPGALMLAGALLLTYSFLRVGLARPRTVFERRNHYMYWSGIFFAVFAGVTLATLGSGYGWASRGPYFAPFVVVGLIAGIWVLRAYRDEALREDMGRSVLEGAYVSLALSYLLPYAAGDVALLPSVVQSLLYTLILLIIGRVTRQTYLGHAFTLVLVFFFSHLVAALVADPAHQAVYFTVAGLLCMAAALWRFPFRPFLRHTLYLSWFVLSGLAIYAALPYRGAMLIVSIVLSAAYLLSFPFIGREALNPPQEVPSEA